MERLTEEGGRRTWKLFRIGWYVNLACVFAAMFGALVFLSQLLSGASDASDARTTDVVIMMGLVVIAAVLLVGAGISRYQARLEGQNLEIKLAINRLGEKLDDISSRGPSK